MEARLLDDVELAELARGGDTDSYEQLVLRYQEVAVRMAYLICGADAEDAAQEAFVKAFYALRRFRSGAPFRPWLLRIVANEARNRCKSGRRREELALRAVRDRPSGAAAPSPEAAVLERERSRALLDALHRLRERDRLVVAYRYLLELSEDETAQILRVPKGTVKSRLSRALVNLRADLEETTPKFGHVNEGGSLGG